MTTNILILIITASLLAIILSAVFAYWVIRLAVLGALKTHTRWVTSGQR